MALKGVFVNQKELEHAFAEALQFYKGIDIENSDRIRRIASIAFSPGEDILDIGSYVNVYPVVLKLLGMKVTVLDSYPQKRKPEEKAKIDYVIQNIYKRNGIDVIEKDLYRVNLSPGAYDRVTAFEVFEHLVNSPKPIMEQIFKALRSKGLFIMTTPNIARLDQRIRALLGRSPLSYYERFYLDGNPYTGHRREMTASEIKWMLTAAGFSVEQIKGEHLVVPSNRSRSLARRIADSMLRSPLLPTTLRRTLVAIGRKP